MHFDNLKCGKIDLQLLSTPSPTTGAYGDSGHIQYKES